MPPCPQKCRCGRHQLPGRPRGDGPSYSARHKRVTRNRGRASDQDCVKCIENGITKKASTWAQVHGTDGTDSWADYVALCRKCHFVYDVVHEVRKARGWTAKNINGRNTRFSDRLVREIREASVEFSAEEIADLLGKKTRIIERVIARVTYEDVI